MDVTVRRIGAGEFDAHVDGLTDVLVDCVEGGASVSFMLPLERARAAAFWSGVGAGVAAGERFLFVAVDAEARVLGTVQLVVAMPDNQPHRADVAKLLVRRDARRRGVGQLLMAALEESARSMGRRVLVLDTITGAAGARLYERLGWQRVGDIPNYALMPDGTMAGTTYYYKHLAPEAEPV